MTAATDLYRELSGLGVTLWERSGQLNYRAPAHALTAARRDAMRAHKTELLALVQADTGEGKLVDTEPSPAMPQAPVSFWDAVQMAKPAHDAWINHVMACAVCRPWTCSYCLEGRRLQEAHRGALQC